jgi:hypothetical protein
VLGWVLEAHFTTPHVVQLGGRLELEHRGCKTNELVLRHMLTAEGKHGGLVDKLPVLMIERPQIMAAEEKPQAATSNLPEVQRELTAGAAQVARHADADKKRELEMARGAERVAYFEGRQAAAEAPVEESYPVHMPGKIDDSDPASSPQR